ncbi:MAG: Mammalian cell entry related domain protein [Verrucomicrobiales bacterium]|nr:Mammalian cell entry related domain protein [Verrucomicrobiales bacterium]
MKNTLETRLGIFFALALVVAVIILTMIGSVDIFHSSYKVYGLFKNAQELKKGDQIKLAGVEIGRVDDIQLENGQARVTMKVQGQYTLKTDSKAVIKFTGLMGQNFVSIEGGSNAALPIEKSKTDPQVIETREQPDLSAIMVKLENVASGVEGLTKSFSPENFSSLLGPVTDFMKQNSTNLTAILSNTAIVTANIAQGRGTVGKLINDDALYNSAFATVAALQTASGQAKTLISKAEGMIDQANTVIGGAKQVMDQINSGQGTLGKLTKDEALYKETTTAMANLREILEKMNKGQGTVGKLINDDSFLKNAKLSLQKLDKATEGLEDQGPLSVLGIAVNSLF